MSQEYQNIVVTGVSSGIGASICETLVKSGYRVFGSVRKKSDATALEAKLGDMFCALEFDVCEPQAVQQAAEKVTSMVQAEGVSALVNNAGLALFGPMELIEDNDFDHIMSVNVTGTRNVTNTFLPLLRSGKQRFGKSRIINISSLSGILNTPMNGAYCVSKHAMESLGEIYRRELRPENIDVVSIRSGPIQSEIWNKNIEESIPYSDTVYKNMAIRSHKIMEHAKKSALPASVIAETVLDILQGRKKRHSYHCGRGRLISQILSSTLVPRRLADHLIVNALNKPVTQKK